MNKINILVVDDDSEIVNIICNILKNNAFNAFPAYNGEEALSIIEQNTIHLIIIDIMMPIVNGFVAITKIREKYNCPIIILSAKSSHEDKILGLSTGADDYLVKPFFKDELIARVNSSLRRYMTLGGINTPHSNVINYYDLKLDCEQKKLLAYDRTIKLTSTEYKIIELLLKHPRRIFSAEEIFQYAWNDNAYSIDNAVSLHISRIRKKIELNPRKLEYLKVIWGIGYKIEKE